MDVAVIDPPRKGCETPVLDGLITSGAKRVIYVSCNPSTLARDVKYLCQYGYQVVKSTASRFILPKLACRVRDVVAEEQPKIETGFLCEIELGYGRLLQNQGCRGRCEN